MMRQYFLNLRSFQANFEIRLNDVLVESDYKDRNLSFAVPVNHWLRKGKNVLTYRLIPYDGEQHLRLNARLDLAIQVGIPDGPEGEMEMKDFYVVNTQDTSGQFDDPVPGFSHTGFFSIEDAHALAWEDAMEIRLDEHSVRGVTAVYHRLQRFIAEKDAAGFVAFTKPKIRDCARALNWDFEEDLQFSLKHYSEIFNRPGYVAWSLSGQQLIPAVEGFGKMITLRNEKRQPPLLLYNAVEGKCIFIDVKLCRPEGTNEFVVIR